MVRWFDEVLLTKSSKIRVDEVEHLVRQDFVPYDIYNKSEDEHITNDDSH
jgi:hypothetical protein